jgi:hypothetical protein
MGEVKDVATGGDMWAKPVFNEVNPQESRIILQTTCF